LIRAKDMSMLMTLVMKYLEKETWINTYLKSITKQ
jgi:hypothetical protein